jgi:hypothetical protein
MPAFHPRARALLVGVAALALVAIGVGGTVAASNPPTLYACFDTSGNVRMSASNLCQLPGGGRLVSIATAGGVGPAGATGVTGPAGATGPLGASGPAGATGPLGASGPGGPTGATGIAGPAGATGPLGASGPTGATGPQGATGVVTGFGTSAAPVMGGGIFDCVLGEIRLEAAFYSYDQVADGHLLPINQYQALFALLGTRYGGNGIQTFAVPDLRAVTPQSANGQPLIYTICTEGVFPPQ